MIIPTEEQIEPVIVYDHKWNHCIRFVQGDRYVEVDRGEIEELIETLQMVQRKQEEREERK